MEKLTDIIVTARGMLSNILDSVNIEQANEIPEGFTNNLIWQFGHVIAVQQGLCYGLSGAPLLIDAAILEKYKNGSKPDGYIPPEEVEELRRLSALTLAQFPKDLADGVFDNFVPKTLSNGIELTNIKDALTMLAMHEGMHVGYSQALKRAIKS